MASDCTTMYILQTTIICFVILFSTSLALNNKKYMCQIVKAMPGITSVNTIDEEINSEDDNYLQNVNYYEEPEINHYDQDYNNIFESDIVQTYNDQTLSDDWIITDI